MNAVVTEICEDLAGREGLENVFDNMSVVDLDVMHTDLVSRLQDDYSVNSIVSYLDDHESWKNEWENLDEETQEEILDDWQIILDENE